MDCATGMVTGELGKIQHFRHRTLTRKSSITMQQQRQHLATMRPGDVTLRLLKVVSADKTLTSSGFTLHHRIDGLKVTRVGCQADANFSIRKRPLTLITQMVFYIAVTGHKIGNVIWGKLIEQGGKRLL